MYSSSAAALAGRAAIAGVGNTYYAADYRVRRDAERTESGLDPAVVAQEHDETAYLVAARAFRRALEDAGLENDDIDGLAVCSDSAYALCFERVGEILGLTVGWGAERGTPDHLVQAPVEGIAAGRCTTVAIVYGNANRTNGITAYGGSGWPHDGYMNQWYDHPWGMSSAGAQYALSYQQYLHKYQPDEALLSTVTVSLRQNALHNENAIMTAPITVADHLKSRYLCRPLRRLDYCMVTDGGVCLIIRRSDLSNDLRHAPVLISGIGRYSPYKGHTQMEFRLAEESCDNVARASEQARAMAGVDIADVDVVQLPPGLRLRGRLLRCADAVGEFGLAVFELDQR